MYLSIIIPFFNESENIEKNILQIINFFKDKYEFEIILINDSGKENLILENINNKFTNLSLINNDKNYGKGYSIRKGLKKTTGEIILVTDADLAAPISEFDKLLHFYKKNNDIVIGSRSCADSVLLIKQPFYRIFIGRVYNILIKFILDLEFKDTQCGFKLFNSKVMKNIITFTNSNRFGLDIELIYFAKKNKYKIYETGVIWEDKRKSSVLVFKDSLRMLVEIFKLRLK